VKDRHNNGVGTSTSFGLHERTIRNNICDIESDEQNQDEPEKQNPTGSSTLNWWNHLVNSLYVTIMSLWMQLNRKYSGRIVSSTPSNTQVVHIEDDLIEEIDTDLFPIRSTPSPKPVLTNEYHRITDSISLTNSILLLEDDDPELDHSQDFSSMLKKLVKSSEQPNTQSLNKRNQYGTDLSFSKGFLSKPSYCIPYVPKSTGSLTPQHSVIPSQISHQLTSDDTYHESILKHYQKFVPPAPVSVSKYSILDSIIPNHFVDTSFSDTYLKKHKDYVGSIEKDRTKQKASAITSLSDNQIQKVRAIWSSRTNKIIVSNFQIDILVSDLKTLSNGQWLNDNIIDFYLNLIMANNPKVYGWTTHFYSTLQSKGYQGVARWAKRRKLNLFEKDLIIIPINILNTHWALALIDNSQYSITYYDSLTSSGNRRVLEILQDYMKQEAKRLSVNIPDYELIANGNSPQQTNGYDCGVFTCTNARLLACRRDLQYSQKDMKIIRMRMTYEISSNNLLS
jgi:sentrin-specific protease 1